MPEILYPGVYVAELAHEPTSISGVTTSTDALGAGSDAAAASVPSSGFATPDWTDTNTSDPGITLLELLEWPLHGLWLASRPTGIASGLDVVAGEDRDRGRVTASVGLAVGADGRTIEPDQRRTSDAACRKPWP